MSQLTGILSRPTAGVACSREGPIQIPNPTSPEHFYPKLDTMLLAEKLSMSRSQETEGKVSSGSCQERLTAGSRPVAKVPPSGF